MQKKTLNLTKKLKYKERNKTCMEKWAWKQMENLLGGLQKY